MKATHRAAVTDVTAVLLCGALLFTVAFGVADRRSATPSVTTPHILVDVGHGGADGGASAADGTQEKDINLAVALPLRDLLHVMGYTVEMTRTEDVMLNTEGGSLHDRKVSDMHHRLQMVNNADLTVSIHQNKFPEAQYWGAQVFYSPNTEDSRALAECVREKVVSLVQPTNKRGLKRGTDSVYLLYHAERPMVLVECGFLSNAEELARLKDGVYRQKLAFAVAAGTMTYIG